MDVVKVLAVNLTFLFLATACNQQKTIESVSIQAKECVGEVAENRFVVHWEDDSFSVERSENLEHFKSTFVKENLDLIKHVDVDQVVRTQQNIQNSELQTLAEAPINWGPQTVKAPVLWNQQILGQGVIVAIVDGMVDVTNKQLRPNILVNTLEIPGNKIDDDQNGVVDDYLGAQFNKEINDPLLNTHGSHVAGIIGADISQGPIQGIAPMVKILPAQFIDNDGAGNIGDAITAMNYAAKRGAKILNLSWGGAPCMPNLASALEALSRQGVLIVTAAGNEGVNVDERPNYPSAFGLLNQINVAASTVDNFLIYFSNFGLHKVQVVAPGVDIESTIPGDRTQKMSGTSMAAPLTAGAAALLWSAYPAATTQQIKTAILRGVDAKEGYLYPVSTRGRINVEKSLAELKKLLGL